MLEIDQVSVLYGKKIQALKGVSLFVSSGEIVALIGANGAGKSTFLKAVSGLVHADSGSVRFERTSLVGRPAHEVARLGIAHVPEGRHIFADLTVRENLELGAYAMPEKIFERQAKMFELFPILEERKEQLGGTLSGGEQQLLAIARALMSAPRLLLLDEPSMGLAPIMVQKVFEVIRTINRQGTTILLVEQNAQASLALAHRAYVLETGTVILEGKGADLLKDPRIQSAYLGH